MSMVLQIDRIELTLEGLCGADAGLLETALPAALEARLGLPVAAADGDGPLVTALRGRALVEAIAARLAEAIAARAAAAAGEAGRGEESPWR